MFHLLIHPLRFYTTTACILFLLWGCLPAFFLRPCSRLPSCTTTSGKLLQAEAALSPTVCYPKTSGTMETLFKLTLLFPTREHYQEMVVCSVEQVGLVAWTY